MKKVTGILLALLLVVCALPRLDAAASNATSGQCGSNLTWTLDANTGTLTINGTGKMDDYLDTVHINDPANKNSAPWYLYRTQIKSVNIGDGVTGIGNGAFGKCVNLSDINIPDGVTHIGGFAFMDCEKLESISIPDSVTSTGDFLFLRCIKLKTISISKRLTKISKDMFCACDSLTSIDIPFGVTSIGESAFDSCDNLTEIAIPSSVTHIDGYIFSNRDSTAPLRLYGDLNSYAQDYADKQAIPFFANVCVPESGTCGANVNWSQERNGTLTISGTGQMYNGYTQENSPGWSKNIQNVVIEDGVSNISAYVFAHNKLKTISIPGSVTSISPDAWYNCEDLISINVDAQNSTYSSAYGILFDKNKTEVLKCPQGKSGTYTLPNQINNISNETFVPTDSQNLSNVPAQALDYNPITNSMTLWTSEFGKKNMEYNDVKLSINKKGECFVIAEVKVNGGDVYVEKYDCNGNKLSATYGGTRFDWPMEIIALDDGGCIIGATSQSIDGDLLGAQRRTGWNDNAPWIFRLDNSGKIIWQTVLDERQGGCYFFDCMAITDDNNLAVCGFSKGMPGYATFHKLSMETGDILAEKRYGYGIEDSYTRVHLIKLMSDGNLIIFGWTNSYEGDFSVRDKEFADRVILWIAKVDRNGEIIWKQFYGDKNCWRDGLDISETTDGGFVSLIQKYTSSSDAYFELNKYSASGQLLWSKSTDLTAESGRVNCLTKDWIMASGQFGYNAQVFDIDGNKMYDVSLPGMESWNGYDVFHNPFAYSHATDYYAYASMASNMPYSGESECEPITVYCKKVLTNENRQTNSGVSYKVLKNKNEDTIDTVVFDTDVIPNEFVLSIPGNIGAYRLEDPKLLDRNDLSCHSDISHVRIGEGMYIIDDSFNDCQNIKTIAIPPSVEYITNSFMSLQKERVIIYGVPGSKAEEFAHSHDYRFEPLISVKLDGKPLLFDRQPLIYDNRTLVPMRVIFEAMGASVEWDNATQTASAKKGNTTVVLRINSNTMQKNTENIILDVPAQLIDDRTMVPVRAIAEAFGASVNWDGNTREVSITQ